MTDQEIQGLLILWCLANTLAIGFLAFPVWS